MTSTTVAKWIKDQRTKKGLSIKTFQKTFVGQHIKPLQRSYGWFTKLEKIRNRSMFADRELEMLTALGRFFGYELTFVKKEASLNEVTELMKKLQNTLEEEEREELQRLQVQRILNKGF